MHQHLPHVLAAAQQIHQTAKYYPMTSYDKKTLREAGVFAGIVAGLAVVVGLARGGGKKTAAVSK